MYSHNVNAGTITFYDFDTLTFFGTFNFNNVYVYYSTPSITRKEYIPYVFRIGDIYELIDQPTSDLIIVDFVRPVDRQLYYTLLDMTPGQVYEYKGIFDNMYVFQQA